MRNNKCFIYKGTLFVPKNDKDALASLKELASQMCQLLDVHELTMTYDCDVTISTEDDSFFLDGEDSNMLPTDIDNCNTIDFLFWRSDDTYSNDKFSLVFNKADSTQTPDYYVFEASRIDSDIRKPYSTSWLHNELDRISKVFDINCQVFSDEIARLLKEETVKEMFPNVHFSCEGNLLLLDKTNTGKGVEYFMSAVLSSINATTPGWILPEYCIKFGEVWDEFDGLEITIYNPVTRDKACISFFEEYKKSPYHETIAYSYCTTYGPIGKDIDELMKRMGIERTKFISDSYEDEDVDMTTADKTFNTEDD